MIMRMMLIGCDEPKRRLYDLLRGLGIMHGRVSQILPDDFTDEFDANEIPSISYFCWEFWNTCFAYSVVVGLHVWVGLGHALMRVINWGAYDRGYWSQTYFFLLLQ